MQHNKVLQAQTKLLLSNMFPDREVREIGDSLRIKVRVLTDEDLNNLSEVEGRYTSLIIKRSDIGLVLIFNFKP